MDQVLGAIHLIEQALGGAFIRELDRFVVLFGEARGQHRRLLGVQLDVDGPVLALDERADLALAVHNQPQRHGLNAAGRKPAPHFVPQQRRNLVAHQPIQYAARLLGVHQVQVHRPRLLERLLDGAGRDLVEHHPIKLRAFFRAVQLFLQVIADGFAFAIRVSRQINGVDALGRRFNSAISFFLPSITS